MPPFAEHLTQRILRREFTVGVVGLGYVGLPLLLRFGEVGFPVIGFDIDRDKIKLLNSGASYIQHLQSDRVRALLAAGRLRATDDIGRLDEVDAVVVCVPTPLTRQREPDLQYIERTGESIRQTLRPGQLVCLESTTYPGTTEELLLTRFAATGLTVGQDFFLAFSPEREDPGNTEFCTATIPKVVGGVTPTCLEVASTLYTQAVGQVVPVSSTRVAEATKILENVYRAVNIALVNELKIAFDRMAIDVWEVIEAAKTKPFGFQAFYPGPGLGGHCIPIDPFYLTWKAREYGVATRFIELAGEVNSAMPEYVVQKLGEALNQRRKPLNGSRVLVLGVAYKKDTADIRESPALEVLDLLLSRGAVAGYSDPYFPHLPVMRRHVLTLDSTPLDVGTLRAHDAVLLITDHSAFPYAVIHESVPLIVDSRHAFRRRGLTGDHVVSA
jgi:UDP-N-acetyl-D-glucosamine dehydrogenase